MYVNVCYRHPGSTSMSGAGPAPYGNSQRTPTFTDHTGRYLFHCHILEHEDHDMMAQFEVKPG